MTNSVYKLLKRRDTLKSAVAWRNAQDGILRSVALTFVVCFDQARKDNARLHQCLSRKRSKVHVV